MIPRSLHFGFAAPDTDAAIATAFYPADEDAVDEARLTGLVEPDRSGAPWPLVIIMPGINVAPDSYRWLASRFVGAGYCAVTYATIGGLGPAGRGITPAIDFAALAPDTIGSRCSATAVEPLLASLRGVGGPLGDNIDFDRVAVGGHSAGGTAALHNTDPRWIPGLRCVFSYGGHTMTSMSLGHGEASVLAVPAKVPVMLMGGAHDGVIASSRDRYQHNGDGEHDPVQRTFDEALPEGTDGHWLVQLAHANHFTICDPIDETSGRSFLEEELRADDAASRDALADILVAFVDSNCRSDARGDRVGTAVASPAVSHWERR